MNNKYSRIDTPSLSDLAVIWDESNSDWRLTAYTNILALLQAGIVFPAAGKPEAESQYSSPTIIFRSCSSSFFKKLGQDIAQKSKENLV